MVHTWTVGRCILYTGIRLLVFICPVVSSFFFLSNFQTLKFFLTLFSRTVRPRTLKLGTHMDSGQMYHVYCLPESTRCCLFIPLFLHFSFSWIFKHLNFSSHFSQTVWPRSWNLAHTCAVGRCIVFARIRLLLLIHSFIFHFPFSPIFKH